MKAAEAYVEIGANLSELQAGMKRMTSLVKTSMSRVALSIKGSFATIGRRIGSIFSGMIKWAKRLTLAFMALAAVVGYKSIKAWQKQEDAERAVAAALRATGQEVDNNLVKLKEQAAAMQKVTRIGDETSLALAAVAIGYGVNADKADDAVKAALGLATKLGKDLNPQMLQYVVLAQQGEFTMLQRYIPALRKTEDAAEKFAIIQKFVAEGYQQAIELGDTQAGKLAKLRNAYGDVLEQIGRILTTSEQGGTLLDWLVEKLAGFTSYLQTIPGIFDSIKDAVNAVADAICKLTEFDMLKGGTQWERFADAAEIAATKIKTMFLNMWDEIILNMRQPWLEYGEYGDLLEEMRDMRDLQQRTAIATINARNRARGIPPVPELPPTSLPDGEAPPRLKFTPPAALNTVADKIAKGIVNSIQTATGAFKFDASAKQQERLMQQTVNELRALKNEQRGTKEALGRLAT